VTTTYAITYFMAGSGVIHNHIQFPSTLAEAKRVAERTMRKEGYARAEVHETRTTIVVRRPPGSKQMGRAK
jgi:hypothetical protein